MKPKDSRICVVLAAVILFFIPPSLHAASFKIKPLVLTGDPAPDGGTFLGFGLPRLNTKDDIAFGAATASGQGVYALGQTGSSLLFRLGTHTVSGRLPDPTSLGLTLVTNPCTHVFTGPCAGFDPKTFDNYAFPGSFPFAFCDKQIGVGGFDHINDSLDILSGNVLISGGSVVALSCPTVQFLIRTVYGGNASAGGGVGPVGITNSGVIALHLSVQKFDGGRDNLILFIDLAGGMRIIRLGGAPAPIGGTIQSIGTPVMNENEDLLVPFLTGSSFFDPQGLLLLSGGSTIPIAFTGSDAPGGRKFNGFGARIFSESIGMNNVGQTVFSASLDDGSIGIFRRDPDGTIKVLFEDRPGFNKIIDFSDVRFMAINEKGEVAAVVARRDFNFRATGDLLFFNSEGTPSKVVSLNGPAPGGGNFLAFFPQINNKGEVIFLAVLSNGKSGIFKASKGLETEFVDPVPDLLVGPTVTTDPTALANNGTKVTGIAADGAAQVVVRVKTGQPGTVEFALVASDAQGAPSLPASNLNGALGQVGSATLSSTVSVQANDVTGVGPMAFAAYHAPMDFATSPNSVEAGLPDRKVFIKVKLTTSTGETVESTEPIKVVRPPVVLVHGLWGSETSWKNFGPLTSDPKFSVRPVDYKDANAAEFAVAAAAVGEQINLIITDYKEAKLVAAVQADVVAHSMGGLVVRMLPLFINGLLRDDNFQLGDVHKLINVGTPNFGTRLAQFLLRSPCVSQFFTDKGFPTNQGAIVDLVPNSQALNLIIEYRINNGYISG